MRYFGAEGEGDSRGDTGEIRKRGRTRSEDGGSDLSLTLSLLQPTDGFAWLAWLLSNEWMGKTTRPSRPSPDIMSCRVRGCYGVSTSSCTSSVLVSSLPSFFLFFGLHMQYYIFNLCPALRSSIPPKRPIPNTSTMYPMALPFDVYVAVHTTYYGVPSPSQSSGG